MRYDLKASKGDIEVARSSLKWEDGEPRAAYFTEYSAYTWDYTEKGYLFFEEYHPSGYDGPSGHTAIRVKPLDEECRKWNRECLEPIGYEGNNMFISDWSEEDFQNLNFDDLYERMYLMSYGEQIPFDFDYGRVEYEVAEDSLEAVFQKYFKIDSQMLREKMTYYSEDGTYHYRARCLYDCGTGTEAPSPEVTAYRANEDGTVTLTVEAVWAKKNMDCAFSHEVTVRLTEGKKDVQEEKTDGNKAGRQIQYVSNRVLPTETNVEPIWYCERLSEEEWKEEYGGTQ